jgi:hypothetical protein
MKQETKVSKKDSTVPERCGGAKGQQQQQHDEFVVLSWILAITFMSVTLMMFLYMVS